MTSYTLKTIVTNITILYTQYHCYRYYHPNTAVRHTTLTNIWKVRNLVSNQNFLSFPRSFSCAYLSIMKDYLHYRLEIRNYSFGCSDIAQRISIRKIHRTHICYSGRSKRCCQSPAPIQKSGGRQSETYSSF